MRDYIGGCRTCKLEQLAAAEKEAGVRLLSRTARRNQAVTGSRMRLQCRSDRAACAFLCHA
jgi:hypothetical protein